MTLARNPVCPFGSKVVASAGTPELLFSTSEIATAAQGIWPTRVSRMYLEALNTNTGFIYIGTKGMDVATMVGVLCTIPPPNGGNSVDSFNFQELAWGANNYRLQDYWIDAAVDGEGCIRTCWQG